MKNYLKIIILIGVILAGICFFVSVGNCQITETEKILTEIRVDIKYIKNNIEEMKNDFKDVKQDFVGLEKRVSNVEYKTEKLESIVYNVENINKWFLGILATIIGGLVLFQYKRANNLRKNNDRA